MVYEIFNLKSGQKVAELDEQAKLHCADSAVKASLERVIGRELLTREDEPGEVVEEGEMCYLGMRGVSPQDPDYLEILVQQLPILTDYEARPAGKA